MLHRQLSVCVWVHTLQWSCRAVWWLLYCLTFLIVTNKSCCWFPVEKYDRTHTRCHALLVNIRANSDCSTTRHQEKKFQKAQLKQPRAYVTQCWDDFIYKQMSVDKSFSYVTVSAAPFMLQWRPTYISVVKMVSHQKLTAQITAAASRIFMRMSAGTACHQRRCETKVKTTCPSLNRSLHQKLLSSVWRTGKWLRTKGEKVCENSSYCTLNYLSYLANTSFVYTLTLI